MHFEGKKGFHQREGGGQIYCFRELTGPAVCKTTDGVEDFIWGTQ